MAGREASGVKVGAAGVEVQVLPSEGVAEGLESGEIDGVWDRTRIEVGDDEATGEGTGVKE